MTTSESVLVDLSNACRDTALGFSSNGASWQRWLRLRAAVCVRLGDSVTFFLVADSNLRRLFSRSDQIRYDQSLADGVLEVSDEADRLLLATAVGRNAGVLSNDRFTDYLKMPGVAKLKVLRWGVRMGTVLLSEVQMELPHSILVTERAEREERKRNWADAADLKRRWRCANAACPETSVLVPDFRNNSALCPRCSSYLFDDGDWNLAAMVKVLCYGEEVGRFILEDGDRLVMGAASDSGAVDISQRLKSSDAGRVSARHLEVSNADGQIFVEDLNSAHGSELLVPADSALRRRAWRPGARIQSGRVVALKRGFRVRLGGTQLVVELSGRQFGN